VPEPSAPPTGPRPTSVRAPLVAFVLATLAAVGLAVVYAAGGQSQVEGALLLVALGGVGVGLALWAKRFMPDELVVEERTQLVDEEARDELFATASEGEQAIGRRRLLGRAFAAAVGAIGLAALFPIRSLGPAPGRGLKQTPYRGGGVRLVDESGDPVGPDRLAVDGVLTVFPEGHVDDEDGQTLLIHLREGQLDPAPGREGWTVQDHVAFSKVCTHAGCPVGLYQEQEGLLLCPCHQSTFDVSQAAKPVFGPATRALPQLPLELDDDGNLIASGDFSDPVGPGFWDRER
jgi:ubiquinol-cytochrome c reductase iron-sulfur subunit